MNNYRIKNKWLILFGAILAQLTIGAMYAWSLFNKPLSEAFNWEMADVVRTYGIALAAFSLTTIYSGQLQLKKGPRVTSLIGACLYSGGIILSSFAKSPEMLYVTYGLMAGSGVGFVYVCQLSTLVKWFPKSKGMITGVATGAFALGAYLFKNVIQSMLSGKEYTPELISSTFMSLGIIYAVMSIIGSLLLDVPEGCETKSKARVSDGPDFSPKQLLGMGNFYKLLFSDLLALMPGLLIIGIANDLGTEWFDAKTGAALVGMLALFNAGGRLASGKLADKFGALRVYRVMYIVVIVALAVLATHPSKMVFMAVVLTIAVGYGSFLSLVPTVVGRLFGAKNFSANYGLVFQAYGMAAMIGISIKNYTKTFETAFTIALATAVVGYILAMLIKESPQVSEEDEKPEISIDDAEKA
mgnify:CR=1 FL=1